MDPGEETFRARATRLWKRTGDFLTRDVWENLPAPRSRRWLYQLARMGVLTWEGLVKTDVFTLSAALTFKVIFSLVPFLAVILAFVKGFGGLEVTKVKDFLVKSMTGFLGAQASTEFERFITEVNAAAVGVVGFSVLLYTSLSLLDTVEKTFNTIWGIKTPRALLRRFTVYWTILTVSPVVLVAMITMKTFVESHRAYAWLNESVPFLGKGLLFAAPFLFAWILFTLVYVIIPNTRVRIGAAFVGALVSGSAWNLMTTAYIWYNAQVVTSYAFYGSLSSIPIFLLWVYFSWIIVLFGAEIAFAAQHVDTYRRELEALKVSASDRDRLALVIALEAVRPFESGTAPPTAEIVAARLQAPSRVVHEIVYQLMDRGILREVSALNAKDPGLVPARDPSVMTARDVLHAVRRYGDRLALPEGDGAPAVYRLIDEAEERATSDLARVTLKDLSAQVRPTLPPDTPAPVVDKPDED